ncbi:MAG: hypothetical protein IBJ12_07305 [Sphingomonadaceae bacterium]|nr:hypothetical protein [Sphingomonadaceae bacterium]
MRTDIFGLAPRQQDMFGESQGSLDTMMTEDEIRAELQEVIDLLRASDSMPWETRQMLRICNMFPDIASKLPDDESAKLLGLFENEMQRLRRAAA